MEPKSSFQMRYLWRLFFLPDACWLRSRHIGRFIHATEREFIFWRDFSKFAVEGDWNSKTFKIGFF